MTVAEEMKEFHMDNSDLEAIKHDAMVSGDDSAKALLLKLRNNANESAEEQTTTQQAMTKVLDKTMEKIDQAILSAKKQRFYRDSTLCFLRRQKKWLRRFNAYLVVNSNG